MAEAVMVEAVARGPRDGGVDGRGVGEMGGEGNSNGREPAAIVRAIMPPMECPTRTTPAASRTGSAAPIANR